MISLLQKDYLEVAQVFHWATKEDYVMWFTGHTARHKRTERILPALVKKGKLAAARYGRKLIYATPERMRMLNRLTPYNDPNTNKAGIHLLQPYHGLSCTRCLVKVVRSFPNCEVIPEKIFKTSRYGVVPEWGIKYPTGELLLFEFCSERQVLTPGAVAAKIGRYHKADLAFATVLFVLDVDPSSVQIIVKGLQPEGSFFFTDYRSFLEVPLGKQLSTPIYRWGTDGQKYSLGQDG